MFGYSPELGPEEHEPVQRAGVGCSVMPVDAARVLEEAVGVAGAEEVEERVERARLEVDPSASGDPRQERAEVERGQVVDTGRARTRRSPSLSGGTFRPPPKRFEYTFAPCLLQAVTPLASWITWKRPLQHERFSPVERLA